MQKNYEMKSSILSDATSTSQKGDNVEQNGRCSASGSQGFQSQKQSYRTEHYEMGELIEMMNFLIDNDRISSCYSINTWKLMARDKSKRQPRSLLKHFKEVLAPNIAQVLKTTCRIREKQLLQKFMKAHEEAQIFENPSSVSLAETLSSSSADSSKVEAASTKLQKSIASKKPKTPMSSGSRRSLDGTVISDSEEETDTKDTRLIKVPPLINGSAGQRPVVKESSQSEIKKSAPVTSDIRITKELGKSADAVSTPSIEPKTEPKEDEDDVVLIETAAWNDEAKLVEVKLPIEPSDESAVETAILPPVVNRRNDDNNRQMQSVEEESRTELNGGIEFSNCLRLDQDKPCSPSVPSNAGESHPVGIEEEKREKNLPTTPEAEIPFKTELKLKNESQTFTSGTPPLQVDSSWRSNDVKQEKPCTSAPTISDYRTHALDHEELIIKEEFPVSLVEVDPRLASPQRCQLQLEEMQNCIKQLMEVQSADPLNEVNSTDLDDGETKFPPVRETTSKATMQKNSGIDVKKGRKRSNSAAGSDAHFEPPVVEKKGKRADNADYNGSNPMKTAGKSRQETANGDDANSYEVFHSTDSDDNEKTKREEYNKDNSKCPCFHVDYACSKSPCRSIKLWKKMYGPITVGRRKCRKRIEFNKDFSIERKKLPEDSEFSQELLNALNHDMRYAIQGQDILADLAVLHYFICRPRDIQSIGGRRVFEKIYDLKWKILQTKFKIGGLGFNRFHNYIRGYIDEFGLPEEIMNEFLHWEWEKSLKHKTKK